MIRPQAYDCYQERERWFVIGEFTAGDFRRDYAADLDEAERRAMATAQWCARDKIQQVRNLTRAAEYRLKKLFLVKRQVGA